METIDAEHILVPDNRQRREFDEQALAELSESILSKGLMHPIVLRNDKRTLVAGERRLRACQRLFEQGESVPHPDGTLTVGQVPYTLLGDLSPLELREAELEENVARLDLTWKEHAAAVAELHQLREAQAEERGESHNVRDTANEILGRVAAGSSHAKVTESLLVAEHLSDPEVASAKSRKEAVKIIERKKTAEHRARLAAEFGEAPSEHSLAHGDAFELLNTLTGQFNIVLTDPPYGVEADSFGDQAGAKHAYTDTIEFALRCYGATFTTAQRLCADSAFIFAFCDIRIFPVIADLAGSILTDWAIWDTPLIWDKGNGMLPVPERGPRRNYEAILYAYRGTRKWLTTGTGDVISIPAVAKPEFGAQKPPELYKYLLERVAQPGDNVLDPFAGTCPVIPAAEELSCRAYCIEQNKEKVDYARLSYFA
jgi:ParB-like chromosome segregation protein Spo0J